MEEQILQIYRSNNVWLTKNMAKAIVEKNIKQLHPNNIAKSAKDGEPIVARFYTQSDGYTFSYSSQPLQSDPYGVQYSADHVWVDGFDSFTQKPSSANYNSAYYIRVKAATSWFYYVLEPYPLLPPHLSENVKIGSVTGIVFNKDVDISGTIENRTYLEWIDNDLKSEIDRVSVNQKKFIYNPSSGMMELFVTGNDIPLALDSTEIISVNEIDHVPESGDEPGLYAFNGNIYIWDGTSSRLWTLDNDTVVTDAISVLNHLTYNIDIGEYNLI